MSEQAAQAAAPAQAGPAQAQAQATAPANLTAPAAPAVVLDGGANIGEPAKPLAEPAAPQGFSVVQYEKTGDAGLDVALSFVGNLGIGPEDAAMKAATEGDFGPLKLKLAALGDKAKGFEQYVDLAAASHKTSQDKAKSEADANTKLVEEAAGGKETWVSIQKWASENAEPAERTAVNAALKAGGIAAKAMVQYLKNAYERSSGAVVEPAAVVAPSASGKAAQGSYALTAGQYATEVQQARQKLGYKFNDSQEYKVLQARRTAGQNAGI